MADGVRDAFLSELRERRSNGARGHHLRSKQKVKEPQDDPENPQPAWKLSFQPVTMLLDIITSQRSRPGITQREDFELGRSSGSVWTRELKPGSDTLHPKLTQQQQESRLGLIHLISSCVNELGE